MGFIDGFIVGLSLGAEEGMERTTSSVGSLVGSEFKSSEGCIVVEPVEGASLGWYEEVSEETIVGRLDGPLEGSVDSSSDGDTLGVLFIPLVGKLDGF